MVDAYTSVYVLTTFRSVQHPYHVLYSSIAITSSCVEKYGLSLPC